MTDLRCCLDVAVGPGVDEQGRVCRSPGYLRTIAEGPDSQLFDRYKTRIKGMPPASFADCNAKQKRLLLYATLHRMLYGSGARGQRDPMPECIKAAVRDAYPDPAASG